MHGWLSSIGSDAMPPYVVGVQIGVFEGVTFLSDAVEAAAGVAGVGATSSRLL